MLLIKPFYLKKKYFQKLKGGPVTLLEEEESLNSHIKEDIVIK